MYKKLQHISFLLFVIGHLSAHVTSFYFGTIKSTKGSIATPIPYYYRGNSGLLMAHNDLITFEIPADPREKKLYLLVTDLEPRPVPEQNSDGSIIFNTFQYLELADDALYRFFTLERSNDGSWSISEEKLTSNRTIPDQTIVLLYFPELISHIAGGSLSELPTFFIDPLPHELETHSLHVEISERLTKMHLSAINLNTIHTPVKYLKHHKNNKILIAQYV
jgi:hypothetical protein